MTSSNVTSLLNQNEIHPDVLEKFQYTWAINNFDCFQGSVGETLQSPEFPDREREDEIKWKLLLYPGGRIVNGQDYISLYLYLISCSGSQVEIINSKFSVVNVKDEKGFTLEFAGSIKKFETLGYNHFIAWEDVLCEENDFLPDNQLTIFCEIRIKASSPSANTSNNISVPNSTLSRDFGQLYDSHKFCDVILYVGDTEFKAHKAILSVRSRVFGDIFERENGDRVEITDIDAPILREILRFIYTEEVINLKASAEKLLAAANKFALERLKFMCGRVISKSLTEENVSTILQLADLHNAKDLKSRVNDFISQQATNINQL